MRRALILAVLAGAGCAAPQAVRETATFREIPTRFELAGLLEDDPGQTVPEGLPAEELGRIIRSGERPQRRVDAVRRLSALCGGTGSRDAGFIACVETLAGTAGWLLSSETDPRLRRYGVFMLFAQAYSKVDASLPFNPADPGIWGLWKSVEELRRRGLQDQDERLRNYFQRYVPLEKDPDWKAARERLVRVTEEIIQALPRHEASLRERLKLLESVQASQLQVKARLDGSAAAGLPPRERAQFLRALEQQFAYRLYSAWANLYAANIIEAVGEEAARRFGVEKAEVKLGWPEYRQP